MTEPEARRAHGRYELEIPGQTTVAGDGEAVVTDEGLSAGGVAVEFLDVEELVDLDRVLVLSLWPEGRLRLSMLGRRHETFRTEMAASRERARVAGLLAHGVSAPAVFSGALRDPHREARLLVYATHLTVVPVDGDPFQIPFGAIRAIDFAPADWNVAVDTDEGRVVFGQLARHTEAFHRELRKACDAQARRLAGAAGLAGFADGVGVAGSSVRDLDRLLSSWTAPERSENAARLVALAGRANVRLGLAELLDPDQESLAAREPLPENLAAFLLAPVGEKLALEILSGPSAATYVFRGDVAGIGRDLLALHFRRRPLALSESETTGPAGRPYRLAFRKLEPLKRLRAATVARVIHNDGWEEALRRAFQ